MLHAVAKETPNLSISSHSGDSARPPARAVGACRPPSPRLFSCFSSTSAYGPPPSARSKILFFGSTVRSQAVRCGMQHWRQCWVCPSRWDRREHVGCRGRALSPGPQKPCFPPRLASSIQRLVNQLAAPLDQDPGSWEGIPPSDYPPADIHGAVTTRSRTSPILAQYNKIELRKLYVWVWVGGNSGLLTDSNTTKLPSQRCKHHPHSCAETRAIGRMVPLRCFSPFRFSRCHLYSKVIQQSFLATTGLQMSERGGVWGLEEMGGNGWIWRRME